MNTRKKNSIAANLKKDFRINGTLYLMVLPVILFYLIFCYKPMYGALIAFQDYAPPLGFLRSPWVGLDNFIRFFSAPDFKRLVSNTLFISLSSLICGFPAPIIFAILINELKNEKYKRVVQTASYLPHFISIVVVCGMIRDFVGDRGFISNFVAIFTRQNTNLLSIPSLFVPIYVISGIWQGIGWESIIYLAALTGIDQTLYEAASIDGAGKWRQLVNITIPGIVPTIVIMLILRIGGLLNVGFEKIILLYNPVTYSTADVISSYVYRYGFEVQDWSYSTAVGLFNAVINFLLLVSANTISKKFNDTGLW